MRRTRLTMVAAVLLAATLIARSGHADDPFQFVTFNTHGTPLKGVDGKPIETDIDSIVNIAWQMDGLLAAVVKREGLTPEAAPILARLKMLSAEISAFIETQQKFIALRAVSTALLAAQRAANQPEITRLTAAFAIAVREYSLVEKRGLQPILALRNTDPELYGALEVAIIDDAEVVRVLQDYLRRTSDALAQKLTADHALQVLMTANLVDSSGRTTAVHLDGYDHITTGDPVPFARFQIQLDQRTQQEFEAAKAIAPIITDGATKIRTSIAELDKTIRTLPDVLKSSDLAAKLELLAKQLTMDGKTELQPLASDIRRLKDALLALSQLPSLAAGDVTDPATFGMVAGRIAETVRIIENLANEVLPRARALLSTVETQVQQNAPALVASAKETLNLVVNTLAPEGSNLKSLVDEGRKIASALGLAGDVAQAADAATRQARNIKAGGSLDTSLDFTTIKQERHPGDVVNVAVTVRRGTGDEMTTLFQGRQAFRIEKYGWYSETRGALLFVEPIDALARNVSFQPAPAIGYYWHYGAKNRPGLNHELALGIGATLTLLDFDDHDMELGVAFGITFLHDLFWAGAGRNLQAHKNYYYVGINPLALTGLFRR